jgi:TolA-binding protein
LLTVIEQLVRAVPGKWRSMTLRFIIVILLSLMFAAITGRNVLAQQGKSASARFAVVIGNAKYPDSDAPLKDAANDAREMAKELRREGFDVDIGENLTKDAMRSVIERLYGKIKPGCVALIFFSGYGIQSNRQSYMIPVDAQIWTEADVRRDGFNVDATLNQMNIRGANVKIAILNASRRNPFERRFRPVAAGLAPVIAPPNTMIMYSAAPGTVVSDAEISPSLFVTELIKEMRAAGLSGEDVLTHTRLSITRASHGEQTPWFSSSLAEEFYFDSDTTHESKPPVAIPTVPESKPATDAEAELRRDYQHAGQIGTRKAWNEFLDKHPTGHYALLAEDELAKLGSSAVAPQPVEPELLKPALLEKSPADDEALRELDRQLERDPNDATAHYKRGILYAKSGDFRRAVTDFSEVIRANPNDADAFNNRCWARAMLGDLQTALKDCDEALSIRPRFADALDSRGLVKLKIGLPRNAITDYDASLSINVKQASSLYGRGIAKMRSGNSAGGNRDIAAAKSINPGIAEEFSSYGIR